MSTGASSAPILLAIVPTQNEPSGATTPSFSLMSGRSGSITASVRNGPPKSHSAISLPQPDDRAAVLAQADRGDEVGHVPGLVIAGQRVEPMDLPADDVDPYEPLPAVVPDQALADDVLRVEDELRRWSCIVVRPFELVLTQTSS